LGHRPEANLEFNAMLQTTSPPVSPLPPGPRVPAWWQLVRFAGDPLGFLDDCHHRYGDAFTLHVAGNGRFVMLSDPEAVREVFRGDPDVLHSGEANSLFSATVGRHSVLVLDGAAHARQRRVVVPPFKGDRMRAFFDAMRLEALEAIRTWPIGSSFPTLPTMRRITLRVILRTGLGLEPGPERLSEKGSDPLVLRHDRQNAHVWARGLTPFRTASEMDRFEKKIERFLSNGRQRYALVLMTIVPIQRLSGSRWAPLFRQLRDLDDDLFAFIAARRRGEHLPTGQNVLDDLLAATHEDGTPLADQEVRDALITILIAGHDTTALALSWALSEIAEYPEVVDRLADELRRATGGQPPEADHLPALEYLEAAIRESLRLRPVAPFVVRKTVRPFVVGGHEYPAGVVLCPCSYLVHRREDLYPEPWRFRPERFLERKFGPHEWFPFGGGNRVCLGMPFALYEMKVLLATVLSQVRPSRPTGARSLPRRYGIVLGPDDGGRVIVRPIA
jgi:cytochrome P450